MLFISRDDILNLIGMDDLIGVMEGAFRELALGSVEMPLRHALRSPDPPGTVHIMPAMLHASKAVGLKVVAHYSANPTNFKLPTINAMILHLDYTTGRVIAILDGTHLTAMRTAAVSGLATRYLARKDSRTVGLIGSGVQAATHLEAMQRVRPIASAKVFSPTPSHREAFAKKFSAKLEIDVEPVGTGKEAATHADIVVTATPATEPVLKGGWLADGCHVNAVGSGTPGFRELDESVLQRSKIVADDIEAAASETGDFLAPMREGRFSKEQIHAGLGDLVIGRKEGRTNDREITLFKSVGLALEDVSAAKFIYERAVERGLGKEVQT